MTAAAYRIPSIDNPRPDIFEYADIAHSLDYRNRAAVADEYRIDRKPVVVVGSYPAVDWGAAGYCQKWDQCHRTPGHDAPCRGFLGRNPEEHI